MKKNYRHLSHKDRITIYEYLYRGYSIQEITIVIGYHKPLFIVSFTVTAVKLDISRIKPNIHASQGNSIGQLNSIEIQN